MSYRRSFNLSWLVLAIVVLFLVNLQAAAAQPSEPPTSSIAVDSGQPVTPPQPEKMTFQPPVDADSVSDFLPPRTRLTQGNVVAQELTAFNQEDVTQAKASFQVTDIPLRFQRDTAIQLAEGKLNVIVEGDTFDTQASLEVISLAALAPQAALLANEQVIAQDESTQFMQFELEMVDDKQQAILAFRKNVRLVVDLREYGVDLDQDGGYFYLAYQDENEPDKWREVPVTYHDRTGLISAETAHFSNWQAGWRPEAWSLEWRPPSASEFTGAASYQYPIQVPPGRNGLQPSVGLSYSSASLRGAIKKVSYGTIATGWSMNDISIVRTGITNGASWWKFPDTYRLSVNGVGGRLISVGTEDGAAIYRVEDLPQFKVYSYGGRHLSDELTGNTYWIVKDGSGTEYRLGFENNTDSRQGADSMDDGDGYDYEDIIAWHVDRIGDAYGNKIAYDYIPYTRGESSGLFWCPWGHGVVCNWNIATVTSQISEIHYNFDQNGANPASHVQFHYDNNEFRLTDISIYHGALPFPMRKYVINATTDPSINPPACDVRKADGSHETRVNHTRIINWIEEQAWDPNQGTFIAALPRTTFAYQSLNHFTKGDVGCYLYQYLSEVENGYGGSSIFTYESDDRTEGHLENCKGWIPRYDENDPPILLNPCDPETPTAGYNYSVKTVTHFDGINNSGMKTQYNYDGRCYDQYGTAWESCPQPDTDGDIEHGVIGGYNLVEAVVYDFDGSTPLRIQKTYFHHEQDGQIDGKNKYGRPYRTEMMDGNRKLLQSSDTTYVVDHFANDAVRFTYASETSSTQYDNGIGTPFISTKTVYDYNISLQKDAEANQIQLGQLTAISEYDENNQLFRTTKRWYRVNNNWVIKPVQENIYVGPTSNPVLYTWIYYDNQSRDAGSPLLTKGSVTRVRQLMADENMSCSDPTLVALGGGGSGCTHAYRTIDQTFGNNDYGNVITQTTYAEYGYQTQRIGSDPDYNLKDYPPRLEDGFTTTTIDYDSSNIYPVKTTVTASDVTPQITQFEIYGFNGSLDGFQTQPGLLKKVVNPNGTTAVYEYDPFGRLWAVYDTEEDRLDLTNRSDGFPAVRYRYFDNLWNSSGEVFLDPAGTDPGHDRPTPFMTAELIRPGDFPNPAENNFEGFGYNSQTYYDGFGRPIQTRTLWAEVEDDDGQVLPQQEIITIQEYDALGHTICGTTPFSVARYDQRGVTYGTSPFFDEACQAANHSYTLTEYDVLGRPTKITPPSGTNDSTSYDYKIKDTITVETFTKLNYVQVVDGNKHVTNSFYNARGELVQVREYSGTEYQGATDPYEDYAYTTYSYDLRGNLTKVMSTPPSVDIFTSPEPSTAYFTTTMKYDALGRKTSMSDADMGDWEYIYDAAGNLTEQYDGNENRLCFYYDRLNRLITKTKTNEGICPPIAAAKGGGDWLASYTYDIPTANAEGQLYKVEWALDGDTSSETFEYGDQGQIVTHTRIINGRPYQMSTLKFDPLLRPKEIQYPNGEIVEIGYDHEGENSLKAGTDELVTDIRYNSRGQIETLTRGNSAPTTTYDYFDASGNFRLNHIQHGASQTDALPDFAYIYDPVGNIEELTTIVSNSSDVQAFNYDHLNRLIGVSSAYDHTYVYDEIGNLTARNLGSGNVQYDYTYINWESQCATINVPSHNMPHAVKEIGSDYFCYDDNGNMVTRFEEGVSYTQNFDVENRLSSVEKTDAGTTTFFYDASGQRVMTVKPNGVVVYTPFPTYEEEIQPTTPGVLLQANNEPSTLYIEPDTSFDLSWSSANTTYCDLSWSNNEETSGNETIPGLDVGTYTYTATCYNSAGVTSNGSVTVIVKHLPTVTITGNNQTSLNIGPNISFTLAWSSSNAQSCTASGSWTESIGTSGSMSKTSGGVGSTQTYTITCGNEVGSVTQEAMVYVYALPQVSYIKANNQSSTLYIKPSTSFTLSWVGSNANNCTASGNWSGTKNASGSQSISGFSSGSRSYSIKCSNNVGTSATKTVTVVVVQNPTVTLSANLSSVVSNNPLQLTWSSSSSQSCSASWTNSTATNGSKTVYPTGEGPKTYTITCTNRVGVSKVTSRSVTVIAGNDLVAVDRYVDNGGPCAGKTPKSCQFDTRTVYYNSQGDKYEAITAYGKYWNFKNGVAQSGNGSNLTNVSRYTSSNGPCAGKSGSNCVFDSRHIYYDTNGNKIETITAYGRYYNYTNGTAVSSNGGTLTSVSRYSSGPCAGKSGTNCKFDNRVIYIEGNGHRIESIYAYGRYYHFDLDNSKTPWSSNGSYSTGVSRYTKTDGTGACAERTSSLCTFDTRTIYVTSAGETIESISAYGKYYNYVQQNGAWVPWGMPIADATIPTSLVAQVGQLNINEEDRSGFAQPLSLTKPGHLSRIVNEIAAGTQVVIQRSTYAIAGQTIAVREVTLHYDSLLEPTVTLSANLSGGDAGDPLQLSWTSDESQICFADWTGSTATNGTQIVVLSGEGSQTFSITCMNLAGESASDDVSVSVIASNDLVTVDRYVNDGGPCVEKAPSSCQFDTRVVYFNPEGDKHEAITAYGKYWNFINGVAQSDNGTNLTEVERYHTSNGPCANLTADNCTFDSRHIYYNANGNKIETITANDKYYNYENGIAVSSNGSLLTSVSRYASGPCSGQSGTSCKFDNRTIYVEGNGHRTESIYAYGGYWNFDLDDGKAPWPNNGSYSTDESRYTKTDGTGPCAGKIDDDCTFDTRTIFVTSAGETIESISAYGKYYNYVNQNGTWVPWGMPVADAATATVLVAQFKQLEGSTKLTNLTQPLLQAKPHHLARIMNSSTTTLQNNEVQSSKLFFMYSDHLGSTSAIQKDGSTEVNQVRYYPFGDWRGDKPENLPGSRGYTGHMMNNLGDGADDLGLIYMNARYYLPNTNRFLTPDTIVPDPTNPQSFNRYAYVYNNPINYVDPSGHCSEDYAGENYNYDECVQIATYLSEHYSYSLEEMMGYEWNNGGELPTPGFWHDPYSQGNNNFGYQQLIFEDANGLLAIQEKNVDAFEIWARYEEGTKTGLVRNEDNLLDNFLGYANDHAEAQTAWNTGALGLVAGGGLVGVGLAEMAGGAGLTATGPGAILGIPLLSKGGVEFVLGAVGVGVTAYSMLQTGRTIYNTSIQMEIELNSIWPSENALVVSSP